MKFKINFYYSINYFEINYCFWYNNASAHMLNLGFFIFAFLLEKQINIEDIFKIKREEFYFGFSFIWKKIFCNKYMACEIFHNEFILGGIYEKFYF